MTSINVATNEGTSSPITITIEKFNVIVDLSINETKELIELLGHAIDTIIPECITLSNNQRYKCMETIYYEDDADKEMFTKGNVYIAIMDKGRGIPGLMSNDGMTRTVRDIPEELTTKYFKLIM